MRWLEGTILVSTCRHFCTLSTSSLNHRHAIPFPDPSPTPRNTVSSNKLIARYVKKGQTRIAHNLFDEMCVKDVVSWNTILSGLHNAKDPHRVHQLLLQMRRDGFGPNEYTISIVLRAFLGTVLNVLVSQIHAFAIIMALNSSVFVGSALMKGYANIGDRLAMASVFDEILAKDVSSWNALISSYLELGCLDEAQRVFDGMLERNVVSWTSLVHGYIRNRRVDKARSVFDQMSGKNVVSWTVMISGYVKNQRFLDALELFLLMLKSGALPNQFTFSSVLNASSGCSSLISGQQVHSSILKTGIPEDVTLSTSLVDMYAKCGDIDAAYCIFGSMQKKNLISWNSIIGGYARHGIATRALEEFERMTDCGVRPDAITFTNVLSACAHGGMIEDGKSLFNSMKAKFEVEPEVEHYACMVDLYGKAGELEEAEKLIQGMPCQPDVVVWCALLGACGLRSSLELGKFAAKELDKLESDHPAIFSTLSRIHGERGVWNSVLKLRKTMKEKGVQKQNAGSWVESAQQKRMKIFSAQVEEGREGQNGKPSVGPVYRNLLSKDNFPPPHPDISTGWDIISQSFQKYPGNRMLGWRKIVDGKIGPYIWKTYKEVYDELLHVGSALRASGVEPGSRIGIYGSNCPQWIMAMAACCAHSLISVPLYDTLGPGAVNYIIDHAEVDVVFVQDKKVKELLNPDCPSTQRLKVIVCFTSLTYEERGKAAHIGIKPYSWNEFVEMGIQNPLRIFPPLPENISTIMYTSGTSGAPKGVVITHENMAYGVRGIDLFMEQFEDKMTVDDVYLSFLPLAHILDCVIELYFFHNGASVGYYHGDLNALGDDILELKPTLLAGVPRVFEKIHEGIKKGVQQLNSRRQKIFDILYRYKLAWMNMGFRNKNASPLADLLAFRKIKSRLGGRIRLIISGGAPLSSEIEEFLRVTCCCFVLQGYGLTETIGPTTLGFPDEMCMIGAVGTISVFNELRLEEVPEMGYNPLGDPPCGEICVRGKTVFAGYHKSPELTSDAIKDGWFHTGDIGHILPNGIIKIIDRKKNLIKLSQGEYVALEYLENVYGISSIIDDIWVYGNSFKSKLVAVVVPEEESTKKWAYLNGHIGSFSDLCFLDQLKSHVLEELKLTAERNKLRGFEYIKGIIVEPRPFDMERGMVTATLKKKRNQLLKYYQARLDELYQNLDAGRKF